ncbi:plasmid maintenance system antidote protein VapI [Flavobacterium sp. 28A]|uniref:XRE family transcriptional regulator n=1 Tax=Flavobacterium sp. 28A TaxID=2735895 RepID=UPI00156E6711|nr:XRE family transcriptional regulator [Flavobacterium sp. 28A]NRT15275.1 plasmid maintenance system antidote protein VapI [Flavobacterium sp. 28A]
MEKKVEKIELELVDRIYKLFIAKFNGNKSAFAKASSCSETTIRRVLRYEQGITVNLLLRMATALDTNISQLFENLNIKS